MMSLRRVVAVTLLCHGVIAGQRPAAESVPASGETLAVRSAPRKLHGRFLHITGVFRSPHPYRPILSLGNLIMIGELAQEAD